MYESTTRADACKHGLEAIECAWCAPYVPRDDIGAANVRIARALSARLARSMERSKRECEQAAGYRLLPASTVVTIEHAARGVACEFPGLDASEVAARVIDRVARLLGADSVDPTYVESVATDSKHANALARLMARRICRRMGTGRGSMPHLPAEFERVEGSPNWSQWRDEYGETVAGIGAAHPTGHHAPGVPERDAPSMRRGDLWSRLMAAGIEHLPAETVLAAYDATRGTTRKGTRVDWQAVAAAVGDNAHHGTYRRRVSAALERLQAYETELLNTY